MRSNYLDSLNDKRKENVATFMKKAYKMSRNLTERAGCYSFRRSFLVSWCFGFNSFKNTRRA